ncbi:MAG: diguanylate cyclase [Desulfovibrionaceae bacterium]|nr:diguanylate cyclase [Desulfovibrionaceae bacterium]
MSRFMRAVIWLIVCVLVSAIGIFLISQHFMHSGFEDAFAKQMRVMHSVVEDILNNTKIRLYQEASLLVDSRQLQDAFVSKDATILRQFAQNAMRKCRANFAIIVDAKGLVLARGHMAKVGDLLPRTQFLEHALAGEAQVDIIPYNDAGLSVCAIAPIFLDKQLVGAMIFGEALRMHAFVDEVKRVTGLEMSIFTHDKRLSTTIIRDGKRVINTTLEDKRVAEIVLQNGGIYYGDTHILGRAYKTMYWPLQDNASNILGMWFIGKEIDEVERAITATAISCLVATIAIAFLLNVSAVFLFRSLLNPLRMRAYVDKLTGITNRAGFEREIEQLFANQAQHGSLFLIDLDNFKKLNDTLGHPVGDVCLKRSGRILREIFRESDLVARLGGDEFVVYAPTLEGHTVIKHKLDLLLAGLRKEFTDDSKIVTVTASIGVATTLHQQKTFDELYKVADLALYQAKAAGRNCYKIRNCQDG